MELVSEAIIFAVEAHDGMRRKKSDAPYILHPMEAAVIVGTMTDDQNLIAAAALHDVVEDADISSEEIEEKFGKRVRELLKNTDDIGILMVWLGDKLANMRSFYREWKNEGEAMWEKFNQSDVNEQAWYYRSIAKYTERLSETSAWIEYKTLTDMVFGKGV